MFRKIALGIVLILFSPLIILLIAVMMVLVLAFTAYGWMALRWLCHRHGCWTFLVCSPRRGWYEFLSNNVLAALPANVSPLWTSGSDEENLAPSSLIAAGTGLPKPYLAQVRFLGIKTRSVHGRLLPLKGFAKKNTELQELLRALLAAELNGS